MSIELQKQIKDNSTSVQEFFQDLSKWTAEQGKEEKRREVRKRVEKGLPVQVGAPKENGSSAGKAADAPAAKADVAATAEDKPKEPSIKRDKLSMPQYYSSWDQYDVDDQLDKLEDEARAQQRAEQEERQAAKDKILDEMALRPDGDRCRTSKARPRVKVSVRRSGRRASPLDLAMPRKEEANRYFAEGRFREAIATYTAGLDLLEKYEPPDSADAAPSAEDAADGTGQETEALALKTALLANRALALLKMEEWREVVVDCTEALRFDPQHHKATLRRGFAHARLKHWSAAARDLERAVRGDASDTKAAAELQMARRMLGEQVKAARAHAKNTMRDPTRQPTMPTRTLQVHLAQASKPSFVPEPRPAAAVASAAVASAAAASAGGEAAAAGASASEPPARKPYVPRSVRMRGRQAVVAQAEVPEASGAAPGMSFYAFEAQWARLRARPQERVALLRRLGARQLPALLRESLDSELVASMAEALDAELCGADGTAAQSSIAEFAAAVLGALARTPRFDLSLRGLSADERRLCGRVLERCREAGQCGEEDLEALDRAYAPPPPPAPREPEPPEEPPAPAPDLPAPAAMPEVPAMAPAPAAEPLAELGLAAEREAASATSQAVPAPAQAFSLDDCD